MQDCEGPARCIKTQISDPLVDLKLPCPCLDISLLQCLRVNFPGQKCRLTWRRQSCPLEVSVLFKKLNKRFRMINWHSKPNAAQLRLLNTTDACAGVVMPPDDQSVIRLLWLRYDSIISFAPNCIIFTQAVLQSSLKEIWSHSLAESCGIPSLGLC